MPTAFIFPSNLERDNELEILNTTCNFSLANVSQKIIDEICDILELSIEEFSKKYTSI
jgi:hypothetical protein